MRNTILSLSCPLRQQLSCVAKPGLQASPRIWSRSASYSSHQRRKAQEMLKHIDSLISHPNPTSATTSTPAPPSPTSLPKTTREQTLERAQQVFGSKLSGASDRQKEIEAASTMIAGIRVPPKPTEPDNCCMSGCINCVWDRYRDEIEEWAAASAEARSRLEEQRAAEGKKVEGEVEMPSHVANSMDDDGGGSEALWTMDEVRKSREMKGKGWKKETDLFEGIPIGIRAFMETERKLKAKRKAGGHEPVIVDLEAKARWLER